jgi:glycosyltransferase involved in cell wall biosynthesis
MRVVLAASKYLPEYTGAAVRLHSLYRSLIDQTPGWKIDVVCGGTELMDRADYSVDDIKVHRIRSRMPRGKWRLSRAIRSWFDAWETWRWLNTSPCDVIHTVGTSPVVATAILYARMHGVPFVLELVTPDAVPDQGIPIIGRAVRPNVHAGGVIVAISKPIAEACAALGYGANVWGRPNPVDTARFFPERSQRVAYRAQVSPFGPNDVVIAAVAKFMPRKNQIFLLDMLAKLESRFKLLLAGPYVEEGAFAERDRAYFEALKVKVCELGLESRVHVVPELVKTDLYIKAADIFAMPIIEEGFGTPVLEAQACAVPVIANSNVPAFTPHIKDGGTGYLRPLDVEAWAQAARTASSLDENALISHAREISERYSFSATRDAYRRILERLRTMRSNETPAIAEIVGANSDFSFEPRAVR